MNKFLITVISCLLLFVCCLVGGYFFIEKKIKEPLDISGRERVFEIKEGQGAKEIGKNLEKQGLIKNDFYFLFYIWKTNRGRNLKAGRYCLSSSQNIVEMVEKMMKGPIREEIKLTFPEGWRISEIEKRLNSVGLINSDEISKLKVKQFKKRYDFLKDAPDKVSLEGYLFPDTYFFRCPAPKVSCKNGKGEIIKCQNGDPKEIAEEFLDNFDKKLTPELREEIRNQGKSIFEIVTMASILEKEVQTVEDKKIVSGIFWKRIKENRPLESCATVAFILGKSNWSFDQMREEIAKAKEIDSPYNTYKYPGLPPGPISNPGIESIKAAIFPKESEYNYFLTDKTGKTHFAKTLEEHNENKLYYLK